MRRKSTAGSRRTSKRLDEHDIDQARDYSRQNPTQFATRIERFQEYLKDHQTGGRFISEAIEAKDQILREWDTYAYRQAYDHGVAHPDDVAAGRPAASRLSPRPPRGRYAADARRYLDWWDKVSVPGQYRVTLRRGEVEPTVGKYLAGGAPRPRRRHRSGRHRLRSIVRDPRLVSAGLGLHLPAADHLEAGRPDHHPDHRLRLVGQRGLRAP